MAKAAPQPTARLLASIASSLDAPAGLAPFLDRVFAPLDSLGAMPRRSAVLLGPFVRAGRHTRVLDAACGKGAVGIALAKQAGCRVFGFDAYPPFIAAARLAAERAGIGPIYRFECDTAESFFARPHRFDIAAMLNLWPVARAARAMHSAVRPGGVYLIDDATLDASHTDARRFDSAPTPEEAARTIEGTGDTVLRVFRPTPSMIARQNASLYRRIETAASALAAEHPKLRGAIRELLSRQKRSNVILVGPLRPTMWVVRRAR